MNRYAKLLLYALMPYSISLAQTNDIGPASEIDIAEPISDEERIKFLFNVAHVYFMESEFDSSINAYERILAIDPDNIQARYVLGHIYIRAKRYDKAEAALTALVKENPDDYQLWNNLGWLYATAEDPAIRDGKKAVFHAQEAMTLAPNNHNVWSTLSEAYYVAGQYEKAYRAITHMAALAARYGQGITREMVESYNKQIRKCKRAMETAKIFKGDIDSE